MDVAQKHGSPNPPTGPGVRIMRHQVELAPVSRSYDTVLPGGALAHGGA